MYRKLIASLGLIVLTFAVYQRVVYYPFINFDDTNFIVQNPRVHGGLSWAGVRWAFTAIHNTNWQPLVWLSYMLDYQVRGLHPSVYHLTNLTLHLANTLLLLIVLARLTGAFWRSLAVAALFALHPLHVESVAWVAERKDVLSTFFLFLALGGYGIYVRRPSVGRYFLVVIPFVLGLMAKPMLVTLPLMLLLLDYWPLGRLKSLHDLWMRLAEKLPLLVLSLLFGLLAFLAQKRSGAIGSWEAYPLPVRVGNAINSYVGYIGKMLWPANLAIFYPHPLARLAWFEVGVSLIVLICVFMLVIRLRRRYPYLLVGWLWYMFTLLPVIGLVQIGGQAMADRYTYVPLIGLFIAAVWGAAQWAAGEANLFLARRTKCLVAMVVAVTFVLSIVTFDQVGYWRNDMSLFSHALAVTDNNDEAELGMAHVYTACGDSDNAYAHLRTAVEINPRNADAQNSLGMFYAAQGQYEKAFACYEKALAIQPRNAGVLNTIGQTYLLRGDLDQAIDFMSRASAINPTDTAILFSLAYARYQKGEYAEAWRLIHACRQLGETVIPLDLDRLLSGKMPEPRE